MIVYKVQEIDWHPQSDSLGVSPLKQTCSTHPFISSLRCLVESLRQLTCFIGCFSNSMVQPQGSGRMEEKHGHEECACVWQNSHAQHGNELSRIKLL